MVNKAAKFFTWFTTSIDNILRRIDMKIAVGLSLVILGVFILAYPQQGTVARIVHYGGSALGYGVTSVIFGGILLQNPRTKSFPILISPIILYIVGFIELIWSVYGTPTPLVIYGLCGLFLLKEIIRR